MKVMISYPPLNNAKGVPLLSQNRQFQYFQKPTYIYPVVPAQAATLLKQVGHQVIWNDCIAEGWEYDKFLNFVQQEKPDLIAMETKTPVIKQHWKIIEDLKLRTKNSELKIVLFGDHVTALPEESFQNSKVDYVLTGGDYDFLLLNLCNAINLSSRALAKEGADAIDYGLLEPGVWYRDNGQIKSTGRFQLNHDLGNLPFIDRDLTKWQLYAYENGNYKRLPGSYIMSGRDCWHRENGGCSFCAWPLLYPKFRVRDVDNVLNEIGQLIEKYRVREIMDDTGTLPVGDWLREFCYGIIKRGYNKKIYLDCNFRFGSASFDEYKLMKKAGYRLLLFGLESANQKTLDKINKKLTVEEMIESCKLARAAGLYPHITIMFGYPWENYEDAMKTLRLGRWLLKKGYAYTMQATVVIPYPGTPLFEECNQTGQLRTLDWDRFDMKEPVMKTPMPEARITKFVEGMYAIGFNPQFILRRLFSLNDMDDIRYSLRAAKKVVGHIFDFRAKWRC